MSLSFNKVDLVSPCVALVACVLLYLLDSSLGVHMLILSAMLIVLLTHKLMVRGFCVTNNFILAMSALAFLSLFLYSIMFDVVEVKPYLERSLESERWKALKNGALILSGLLIGGLVGLSMIDESIGADNCNDKHLHGDKWIFNALAIIAWAPIVVNVLVYFGFFYGKPYVELHAAQSGLVWLLMKTMYISYGAVINIGLLGVREAYQRKALLLLSLGFIFIFAVLFKLRSPLLFYFLILIYFWGGGVSFRKMMAGVFVVLLLFIGVALVRDETLSVDGVGIAMIRLIVSFGDFADTLIFVQNIVEKTGPLYGGGLFGSFLGISESLANSYAKHVDPEYFEEGGGFGFYILSDIFVNFGLWPGFLLMILFGIWAMRSQVLSRDFLQKAFWCILFASVFALVRNDVGSTMRGVVYTLISTVFLHTVLMSLRKR